eukprot:TRINITY_DN8091_c0_g1_i2.p1 TRINITY_DN8091_c0_g1~~TRINITY_DN8091_c0_g1_i2.p1  ORF type:complete len:822 (-),score=34.83 TRINITY_DN8091_c0_g1_i2:88-2508(-)
MNSTHTCILVQPARVVDFVSLYVGIVVVFFSICSLGFYLKSKHGMDTILLPLAQYGAIATMLTQHLALLDPSVIIRMVERQMSAECPVSPERQPYLLFTNLIEAVYHGELGISHYGVLLMCYKFNERFESPTSVAVRDSLLYTNLSVALVCIWRGVTTGNVHMSWVGICDFAATAGSIWAVWALHVDVSADELIVVETNNASFYIPTSWQQFAVKVTKWLCVGNVCVVAGALCAMTYNSFADEPPVNALSVFVRLGLIRHTGLHVLAWPCFALGIADHLSSWARHMIYFPLSCKAFANASLAMALTKFVFVRGHYDIYYVAMAVSDSLSCFVLVAVLQTLQQKHHVFSLHADPPMASDSRKWSVMIRCWELARVPTGPLRRSRFFRGVLGLFSITVALLYVSLPVESFAIVYTRLLAFDGEEVPSRCLSQASATAFNMMIHHTLVMSNHVDMQFNCGVWWNIRGHKRVFLLGMNCSISIFLVHGFFIQWLMLFLKTEECSLNGFETTFSRLMNARVAFVFLMMALSPFVAWALSLKDDELLTFKEVLVALQIVFTHVHECLSKWLPKLSSRELWSDLFDCLVMVPYAVFMPASAVKLHMRPLKSVTAASYLQIGDIRGAAYSYVKNEAFSQLREEICYESTRASSYLHGKSFRFLSVTVACVGVGLGLEWLSVDFTPRMTLVGYNEFDLMFYHCILGICLHTAFHHAIVTTRIPEGPIFGLTLGSVTVMKAVMYMTMARWSLAMGELNILFGLVWLAWASYICGREVDDAKLLCRDLRRIRPFVIQAPREVMLQQIIGAFADEDPE